MMASSICTVPDPKKRGTAVMQVLLPIAGERASYQGQSEESPLALHPHDVAVVSGQRLVY